MTAPTPPVPDVEAVLGTLKPFQRATVELAFARLWSDEDQVSRFLVADEVGLGKTMVAKGVIARAVEHLQRTEPERRIDIIYICSNAQIARQNQRRLNVVGAAEVRHADRLTMLPRTIEDLRANHLNFVSFTPDTSFATGDATGQAEERVVIFHILERLWGRATLRPRRWKQFFRVDMALDAFDRRLDRSRDETFDSDLLHAVQVLIDQATDEEGTPLRAAIEACVGGFAYMRRHSSPTGVLRSTRQALIAQLRRIVARASVQYLEPDLVILDEFQRFSRLFDERSEAAELAQQIFDYPDARVLLLSATPYKMYTLPDEPDGEDHYRDFTRTVRFLAGDRSAAIVDQELRVLRDQVVVGGDAERARRAHDTVEAQLRRVMSRTERLAATPDRDGMLTTKNLPDLTLTSEDVQAWQSLDRVARLVDRHDTFEYWRSTPYPLNLMDQSYKFRAHLDGALESGNRAVQRALHQAHGLLDWEDIEHYRRIDPGNAKMRGLVTDMLEQRRAWALAWVPPSLPYHELGGDYAGAASGSGFTKRLVFSSWAVVPRAIAVLVSYEAERRAVTSNERLAGSLYTDRPPAPPLPIRMTGDRPANLAVLALMYPSLVLARAGDPLEVARSCAHMDEGDTGVPRLSVGEVLEVVRGRVRELLERAGVRPDPDRRTDNRWYALAPFLLDRRLAGEENEPFRGAIRRLANPDDDEGDEDGRDGEENRDHAGGEDGGTDGSGAGRDRVTALQEHLRVIEDVEDVADADLGSPPDNLDEVLALQALAGPGVCALRALSRVCGGPDALADADLRRHAFGIAQHVRSLFNKPEIGALLRTGPTTPAWKAVLNHCLDGCLQAVLDEYVHVLVESEGLQEAGPTERASRLHEVIHEALSLRSTPNVVHDLHAREGGGNGDGVIEQVDRRVNSHLAARYGRAQTAEATLQRETTVRTAFNSPFRPFVLASTSLGQEGLDFHTYCHAIIHWNLPGNPVDLEQREGRVHRYKGHAVRKNVAADHAPAALDPGPPDPGASDPWQALFDEAVSQNRDDHGGMVPFWVYSRPGGATIERYVPALPLSREAMVYRRLIRTVSEYRCVMGQPRQEDLVTFLQASGGDLREEMSELSFDLALRDAIGVVD